MRWLWLLEDLEDMAIPQGEGHLLHKTMYFPLGKAQFFQETYVLKSFCNHSNIIIVFI